MEKEKSISVSQSPEAEKERNRVLTIVSDDKQRRDQANTFFRGANLLTYTEAGMAQFIGHTPKPEWKKDYQFNVFDPITRDKVMAIVSKTAGLYEAEFFNKNKRIAAISETITTVLSAFYKDSAQRLNDKDNNKLSMLAALISPKAIWYEGWRHQKRTIREITERDEYGRITKTEEKQIVHYNGPYGELVPVDDFIYGSLKIRNIQEQPRLAWINRMQIEEFRRRFSQKRYPEAKKVRTAGTLFANEMSDLLIRHDLKENEVEVIYLFEKWDDNMSIVANGILLTPPKNSPMPFAHKDYPFVHGGFEELSPFFVYDMPLTMKLMDMQDMNNEILNLSLDMVWRALNEVILTKDGDEINDDELYGGGQVTVRDPSNVQKFEFGSSFGFNSASAMQERARRSIESASLDAPSSGQSGSRQITAREAVIAREAALEITSLFLQNMEAMERDKAKLRVKNQLDRYKRPVEWEKRIGKDNAEQAIPIFREISVRGTKLDGGKRGTANINITETPRPAEVLDQINVQNKQELSQEIDITPDLIREIVDFDVEIVGNSSVNKSKAQEAAEARAFLRDATAMPQLFNVKYAAEEYVSAIGKNKSEALVQQEEDPMEQMLKKMRGEGEKPPLGEVKPQGVEENPLEAAINQPI